MMYKNIIKIKPNKNLKYYKLSVKKTRCESKNRDGVEFPWQIEITKHLEKRINSSLKLDNYDLHVVCDFPGYIVRF